LAGCGSSKKAPDAGARPVVGGSAPVTVPIVAHDYSFDVTNTIRAGVVRFDLKNVGQEPHFAGIIKPALGHTVAEVKAALAAQKTPVPPPGPPPYEDVAGVSMADGGRNGNASYHLKPGKYLIMCSIPSRDGVPHFAKGMLTELTVTNGDAGALPTPDARIVGTDMALTPVPPLSAGKHTILFKNQGKQLHEINLVQLQPGKTMQDVVRWFGDHNGPPPTVSLGGVAVQVGEEGTTEVDLQPGVTYAFVCAVDDVLGHHEPHITEGMFTPAFTVT
jgi:uncharacterized cupredoxin-like copper-binding protein